MDNQHKHIKGYRDLSVEDIALMNEVKTKAEEVRELLGKLRQTLVPAERFENLQSAQAFLDVDADMAEALRWLGIGEDHLQQGFMAVTRAIARPTTF